MLAIGAVIGAGIFWCDRLGGGRADRTPTGEVIRVGAGPALVVSFLLLGVVLRARRALLRRARVDDSAGGQRVCVFVRDARRDRRVDHRLGSDPRVRGRQRRRRDLVGRLLQVAAERIRITFPAWLTHGLSHGAAQLRSRGVTDCSQTRAAHRAAFRSCINVPAFAIVALITWLLLLGVRESARANNIMVAVKLLVLGAVLVIGGCSTSTPANYHPVRAERLRAAFTRARRSCSSRTSASTRSRRRPRRRRIRSATCRSAFSAGSRSARVIYVIVGAVLDRDGAVRASWQAQRSAGERAQRDGHADAIAGSSRSARSSRWRRAAGVPVRPAAHLLRDGARRPAAAVGGEDAPEDARPARHDALHRRLRRALVR